MSEFRRLTNETENEFLVRLFEFKMLEHLTWEDVREIANNELGYNYSSDKYRKDSYKLNSNIEEEIDPDTIEDYINSLSEEGQIKVDKAQLSSERTQINALYRRISRELTLKEIAKEAAVTVGENIKLTIPFSNVSYKQSKNKAAILELSDIHYGIEVNNKWNTYNCEIAKKRLEVLRDEVIKILTEQKITTLYLVNLGDMIAGKIHLPLRINSQIDVMTQIMEISEILTEFINDLSRFAKIECYFTSDNHSRLEPNLKDNIELEQLSRITPWFIAERLKDNKCVTIQPNGDYDDDIVQFNVLGHKIAAVHGHRDKVKKTISNLTLYTQTHYDLILTAHLHHFNGEESWQTIQIGNGSVMGTDDFAEKLRLNSKPSQNLIIVSENNACECIYKIDLSL